MACFWLLTTGCAAGQSVVVEVGPGAAVALAASGLGDATPEYRHGRRRGIRVGLVRPGSLFAELQLEEGDLVTDMAGYTCDDLLACRTGVQQLTRALLSATAFDLRVERGGRVLLFHVQWSEPTPLPDAE